MYLKEKKSIGISISDRSIEILELVKEANNFDIAHLSRKEFSKGIVEAGRIINSKILKTILWSCLKDASISVKDVDNISFAIPEIHTYTHVFRPELENKDERKLVEEELLNIIPLKKKDLFFKYKKNKINSSQFEFLTLSVDKNIFLEWLNFFKSSGLEVNSFYFEPIASFYGLFLDLPSEFSVLLDMGSRTSNLSVFINKELKYSYGIRIGGEYFTKKIADGLKISLEKAEELKFNYGLKHPANKLYNDIFLKALEHLKIEIQRNLNYFKETYLNNNELNANLYLLGGSSKILGLKDYFEYLDFFNSVNIGEPFVNLDGKREYIEALGLAISFFVSEEEDFTFQIGEKRKKIKIKFNFKKYFSFKNKIYKNIIKYYKIFFLIIIFSFFILFSFLNNNEEKVLDNVKEESEKIIPVKKEVEKKEKEEELKKIRIKSTVSLLNIREGAGIKYSVVGKARANEEYILLTEEGDWQKIELKDKLWGWVNKNFTEIIE